MDCKLCKTEKKLCDSLVIPEFVYKALYDDKHRFHVLSSLKTTKNAQLQKGLRENLLCINCEQILSKYERYASLVFLGQEKTTAVQNGNLVTITDINFKKFKLFQLSVLWRASIASSKMFSQVDLGPHEEKLRVMLLNENPGDEKDYPVVMTFVVHDGKVQTDMIIQPSWSRLDGHYSYRFVFGGIAWVYLVSNHKAPDIIYRATLSHEGETIMLLRDMENLPFISDFANELVTSGKFDEITS